MLGVLGGSFSVYDTMTHFIVLSRVACAVANAVEYCFGEAFCCCCCCWLLRISGLLKGWCAGQLCRKAGRVGFKLDGVVYLGWLAGSSFCSILFISWGTGIVTRLIRCALSVLSGFPWWVDGACSPADFESGCSLCLARSLCSCLGSMGRALSPANGRTPSSAAPHTPRSLVNHMSTIPNSAVYCHWAFCEAFTLQRLLPW